MDVRKFFPSIDHALLKEQIRRVLKDPDVLWLCARIIDGSNEQEPVVHHFPGDALFTPLDRRHGIPIGNLTSQLFANFYLDALDHHVKETLRVRRYLLDWADVARSLEAWNAHAAHGTTSRLRADVLGRARFVRGHWAA
jgi:retron-type reverse transcriptase